MPSGKLQREANPSTLALRMAVKTEFLYKKLSKLKQSALEKGVFTQHRVLATARNHAFLQLLENELVSAMLPTLSLTQLTGDQLAALSKLIELFGEEGARDAQPNWEWDWQSPRWRLAFRVPVHLEAVGEEVVIFKPSKSSTTARLWSIDS